MGHHYVPRQHLRRFASKDNESCVWMYDKHTRSFCEAGIKSVAQEKDYYHIEIEIALADVVESPGKILIDKLLRREEINNSDRSQLSLYFMIMLTRGPRHRKQSLAHVPRIMDETIAETEASIQQWIAEEPTNGKAHERLQELEDARLKFANEIPQNIIDQIRRPFWSEATVECIHNMLWHIIPSSPGMQFVSSDTPAHTFE